MTDGVYVHALLRALKKYDDLMRSQPTVIAGDFNQSVRFDKAGSPLTFAEWMAAAEPLGLRSAYHVKHACAHGAEPDPTFYLHQAEASA